MDRNKMGKEMELKKSIDWRNHVIASSFAEALKGVDLGNLEEGCILSEEKIRQNQELELAQGWLNLLERNASAKEKYLFAQKYGFVSETHLNLWMAAEDDYHGKLEELESFGDALHKKELSARKTKVEELKRQVELIRDKQYYRMIMKALGQRDISPYGEDLLRRKDLSETWDVDIDRTIKNGYVSIKH